MSEKKQKEVFTPYYINQNRLLDLYSVLNNGYTEYEEVITEDNNSHRSKGDANISGGFKLIKISGNASGEMEKVSSSGIKTKRVQTISSILKYVLLQMQTKQYIKNLDECREGDFFTATMSLKLNSIKKLFDMLKSLSELTTAISSSGSVKSLPYTKAQIDNMQKTFSFIFGGLEVYCEEDNQAMVANISESNLYLSTLEDILNTSLLCFGQVKRIYPEGTNLLKNTTFSKLKNIQCKNDLISKIEEFSKNDAIDLNITAKSEIRGKKVYELEIISLCK